MNTRVITSIALLAMLPLGSVACDDRDDTREVNRTRSASRSEERLPPPTTPRTSPDTPGTTTPGMGPDTTTPGTTTPGTTTPGTATSDTAPGTAVPAGDDALATKVEERLAKESGLDKVNASAKDGTVTLSGTVTSEEGKKKAEDAARAVEGVTRVESQITVSAS